MTRMRVIPSFATVIVLIVGFLMPALQSVYAINNETLHSKWDHILKTHVHDGLFDYEAIGADELILDRYLLEAAAFSIDELSFFGRESRIAFWINLYNATVVRLVLNHPSIDHMDPIQDQFDSPLIRAAENDLSLNDLKDRVLRGGFRDERVLLALVSGRMDSPGFLNEAFRGDRLEIQLDQVAQQFIDDGTHNYVDPYKGSVYLSPIFSEYESDFLLRYGAPHPPKGFSREQAAVISFILNHSGDPEKRLFLSSGTYQIHYLPPDSRLNQIHYTNRLHKV
jgi:hypothetical protein